ncbi:MAG: hypothetical protein R2750_12960 [Bacteroidales bacterium]
MKKTILLLVMSAFLSGAYCQDENYTMIMVQHIKSFGMAQTPDDFQNLANTFERISNAESDQWPPLYYTAFSYVNLSFVSKTNEDKDSYLDKAQTYLDKAFEIYPDESELYALQGLLHEGRIQIDPVGRGRIYSMKANEALEKAKQYNPENPRTYYLMGLNILHTPEAFGGGAEPACKLFQTAIEKYKTYTPLNVLLPTWGAERNNQLFTENCTNEN